MTWLKTLLSKMRQKFNLAGKYCKYHKIYLQKSIICYFSANRASLFRILTEPQINYLFYWKLGAFGGCGLSETGPGFLGIAWSLQRLFCISVSKVSSSFWNIPEALLLHHLGCLTRNIFRPSSSLPSFSPSVHPRLLSPMPGFVFYTSTL